MENEVTIIAIDSGHGTTKLMAECSASSYEAASIDVFKRLNQRGNAKYFLAVHCAAAINEVVDWEVEGGCTDEEWNECKQTLEAAIVMIESIGLGDTARYRNLIAKARKCLAECG